METLYMAPLQPYHMGAHIQRAEQSLRGHVPDGISYIQYHALQGLLNTVDAACLLRDAYLFIDFDLGLELCICIWVVQHLPRCILQTSESNDLGLQAFGAFVEGSQCATCKVRFDFKAA